MWKKPIILGKTRRNYKYNLENMSEIGIISQLVKKLMIESHSPAQY